MTMEDSMISTRVGTLADTDILDLCQAGRLIIDHFDPANVKQACYELRASSVYYDLARGDAKYELMDGQYILIKPKQLVVIITLESLDLPADIIGRVLTKGKLFSVGLLPVNTYADPGFYGQLGMVFYNLSNNFLKILPGEAIAKVEFSRLQRPVKRPYHGQHGYQTKIWPVPKDVVLPPDLVAQDPRIGSPAEEIRLAYGRDIGAVMERVFRFERYLVLAAAAYMLLSLVLIFIVQRTNFLTPLIAVILGIVSNLLTTLLVYFATNLRRKQ